MNCYLCKEPFTKFDIPDNHHPDKQNKPDYTEKTHHVCHLKHHGFYPKNYNELRYLVEAKVNYQKVRRQFQNQLSGLKRMNIEFDEKEDEMFKLMVSNERNIVHRYGEIIKKLPIWRKWLSNVYGIGSNNAGQLIGRIGDISKFEHVSNLWSYCGYGLYDNKIQGLCKGQNHNFNHRMRSLIYNIVMNGFIMKKKKSYYGQLYDKIKQQYRKQHPKPIPNPNYNGHGYKQLYTDMHIHLMSVRKTAKIFLRDLWIVWRTLENLPVTQPYEVEHLGMQQHKIPHFEIHQATFETHPGCVRDVVGHSSTSL